MQQDPTLLYHGRTHEDQISQLLLIPPHEHKGLGLVSISLAGRINYSHFVLNPSKTSVEQAASFSIDKVDFPLLCLGGLSRNDMTFICVAGVGKTVMSYVRCLSASPRFICVLRFSIFSVVSSIAFVPSEIASTDWSFQVYFSGQSNRIARYSFFIKRLADGNIETAVTARTQFNGNVPFNRFLGIAENQKFLLSASDTGEIRAWSLDATNKLVFTLEPRHGNDITSLYVHNSSGTLVTGGKERCIKIWNLATKNRVKLVHSMFVPGIVKSILIVGDILLTGGSDGFLRSWKKVDDEHKQTKELRLDDNNAVNCMVLCNLDGVDMVIFCAGEAIGMFRVN
eukprot:TRINITY_DN7892_c0_g1_i1.p1 TRINITY_DN7892_c0_g1~~TRINITY_DN7892_c0_g1_i1.p1  ORF type:complete len:340 (-),score=40.57 TRINITY_DN7892_c0_g1_i1:26-1045(-)